jgi:hypothetical protein
MTSGSKCRHLNSAGGLIMEYTAAYQTRSLRFCNTAASTIVGPLKRRLVASTPVPPFTRL